jgi:hypothetical protein
MFIGGEEVDNDISLNCPGPVTMCTSKARNQWELKESSIEQKMNLQVICIKILF